MWYYAGHLGGMYSSDYELSDEETYCETCGDGDVLVGYFDTMEEALIAYMAM
jgi:hypothetical protein